MKPTLFIRVASVTTFMHAAMHTIGGVFGKTAEGPATTAVAAMKCNQFLLLGHMRSYWDFYRGMGLTVSILLTAEAVVLWQFASLAKSDAARLRPIIATFLLAYAVLSVNSSVYFFFGPVVAELVIAACLGMAFATAKVTTENSRSAPLQTHRQPSNVSSLAG
jgi:hypothetical protein